MAPSPPPPPRRRRLSGAAAAAVQQQTLSKQQVLLCTTSQTPEFVTSKLKTKFESKKGLRKEKEEEVEEGGRVQDGLKRYK